MRFSRSFVSRSFFWALGAALLAGAGARADTIRHPTAIFAGLDKITGRIINFDEDIGETVQFGALRVKTDACYTRPATEAANTDAFVEVDEITLQGEVKRIFSGWMFAASPGLHGVEHPIYDIWLTDCKGGVEVTASPVNAQPDASKPPPANAAPPPKEGAAAQKAPAHHRAAGAGRAVDGEPAAKRRRRPAAGWPGHARSTARQSRARQSRAGQSAAGQSRQRPRRADRSGPGSRQRPQPVRRSCRAARSGPRRPGRRAACRRAEAAQAQAQAAIDPNAQPNGLAAGRHFATAATAPQPKPQPQTSVRRT